MEIACLYRCIDENTMFDRKLDKEKGRLSRCGLSYIPHARVSAYEICNFTQTMRINEDTIRARGFVHRRIRITVVVTKHMEIRTYKCAKTIKASPIVLDAPKKASLAKNTYLAKQSAAKARSNLAILGYGPRMFRVAVIIYVTSHLQGSCHPNLR